MQSKIPAPKHVIATLGFVLGITSFCNCALAQYYTEEQSQEGYQKPTLMGASEQVGEEAPEEEPENVENPFDTFTVAPALGYAYFMPAKISAQGINFEIQSRNSFLGQFHIDFGGDGAAFEMIPFIAIEAGGSGFSALNFDTANSDNALGGTYYALGGRGHLVYRFRVGKFFPHFGIGAHLAYLMGSEIQHGAELYGRIPFGFTVYLLDYLGFVVEGGVMYGVTGVQQKIDQQEIADAVGGGVDVSGSQADIEAQARADALEELESKFHFGRGWAFDVSVGLRFP